MPTATESKAAKKSSTHPRPKRPNPNGEPSQPSKPAQVSPPKSKSNPPKPKRKKAEEERPNPSSVSEAASSIKLVAPAREIIYDKIDVKLMTISAEQSLNGKAEPLTAELAKEILGWQEESENIKFGNAFLFTDKRDKKVRCFNNLTNRPFYPQLAEAWMLEILRKKWRLNGETIIIDRYGMVHDGQHRLIGLVWAVQEWEMDRKRNAPKWAKYWETSPPEIDAILVLGIEDHDDCVNTIGTGKPRSAMDVLYRSHYFADKPDKERRILASHTSSTIRLLWRRTRQDLFSDAPHRPHSEMLAFLENHKRILEAVKFILAEGEGKISKFVILGCAAALLYLMGASKSDDEIYREINNESVLDWSLWDKACAFWVDIAANGAKTEALREVLLNLPTEAAEWPGFIRNVTEAHIIKAWNLFSDGEEITEEAIEVETKRDGDGKPAVAESIGIGGIDLVTQEDEEIEEE